MNEWKQTDREIEDCVCGPDDFVEAGNVSVTIRLDEDFDLFCLRCTACGCAVQATTQEEVYVMWDAAMKALAGGLTP